MATIEQQMRYMQLLEEGKALDFYALRFALTEDDWIELYNSFKPGLKVANKKRAAELEIAGSRAFGECLTELRELIEAGDDLGVTEILDELSPEARALASRRLGLDEDNDEREPCIPDPKGFDMLTPF